MWPLRKKSAVGIDIGDFSIEVVQLDTRRRSIITGRTTFGESVIRQGRIIDKIQLTKKLKDALESAKPASLVKKRGYLPAIVSLPESQTFTHVFTVDSDLSGVDLQEHVLQEIRGVIPLDIEKSKWDFDVFGSGEATKQVVFVSSPREVVDEFVGALREARINTVAVDTELMSICRATLRGQDKHTLIMDLGANRTLIGVVDGTGTPYISVTVPIGGKQMTSALAQTLNIGEGEAEKLKRNKGFLPQQDTSKIHEILQQAIAPVLNEAKKALAYMDSHLQVQENLVLLVGGVSLTPGIEQFLSERLSRTVRRANPADVLESKAKVSMKGLNKEPLGDSPVLFATAIGLAMRGSNEKEVEHGINIIKEREVVREKRRTRGTKAESRKGLSERKKKREGKFPRKRFSAATVSVSVFFVIAIVVLGYVIYAYLISPA